MDDSDRVRKLQDDLDATMQRLRQSQQDLSQVRGKLSESQAEVAASRHQAEASRQQHLPSGPPDDPHRTLRRIIALIDSRPPDADDALDRIRALAEDGLRGTAEG